VLAALSAASPADAQPQWRGEAAEAEAEAESCVLAGEEADARRSKQKPRKILGPDFRGPLLETEIGAVGSPVGVEIWDVGLRSDSVEGVTDGRRRCRHSNSHFYSRRDDS
jgi:hypothetical protein